MKALVRNNVETTLLEPYLELDSTITLETEAINMLPTFVGNSFNYFYLRLGTDETHEIVKIVGTVGEDSNIYILETLSSTPWPSGTPVKLTVCRELLETFRQEVSDMVIHIGGNTPDFDTLVEFESAFMNTFFAPSQTLTVYVHGHLAEVIDSASFANPERIMLEGDTLSINIVSVQSSSGSSGNYSIVLNVSTVTGIVVDDLLQVGVDSVSGGTNSDYLFGVHKITNVDAVNTRITIKSTHLAATAPSGSVAGTATVFTTWINSLYLTVKPFGGFNGIGLTNEKTQTGVVINAALNGYSYYFIAVDCLIGIELLQSQLILEAYISDCTSGCILSSSSLRTSSLIITGCSSAFDLKHNSAFTGSVLILGCSDGLRAFYGSIAHLNESFSYFVPLIKDTVNIGVYAETYSYLFLETVTLSNNGTDYDPALKTQGNKYGYIDDGT